MMARTATKLTWKRPRREDTDLSRHTVWESHGRNFRVVRAESKYGLPTRFVAMRRAAFRGSEPALWRIISNHRTKAAAEKACEREARAQR